ncbi:hypothetical protein LTS18_002023, partial [Coniosporium uncinatum]
MDDVRPPGKKIGAYAHLLALVLRDRDFFQATKEEMTEYFSTLLNFVDIPAEQKPDESNTWIGRVLLIAEQLLSEDAAPQEIKWDRPKEGESSQDEPSATYNPLVGQAEKEALFDRILNVLPRVGKNQELALSILRIMVILTRNRSLAASLGRKLHIQKLFLLIKQLAGLSNERIQSAFMIILRHVVEDEETVRQLMRGEIQTMFEGRTRQYDTTTYVRQLNHLIVRNPE